jgi:hypothetical protein
MLFARRHLCAFLAVTSWACTHPKRYTDSDAPFGEDASAEEARDAASMPSAPDAEEADDSEGAEDATTGEIPDAEVAPTDAGSALSDADTEAGAEGPSTRGGNSFASALLVKVDAPPLMIDERSAEQVDYFAFQGEAGKFYELKTDNHTFSPDNVLKLFDSEQHAMAESDDGALWPGDAVDARLLVHIAKSGTYYLTIEDPYTTEDFFSSALPLLYYHLSVREITPSTPGFALAKAGEQVSAAFQHDDKTGYDYVTLLGTPGTPAEPFVFQGQADKALIGHVTAGGPQGDGSSFEKGRFRVSAEDAGVLAEIDRASGQANLHPPIGAGSYTLGVDSGLASELGENAYYSLVLVQLPDNPREQAEASNNLLAGAEAITFSGNASRRGLFLAQLASGDVDYFRFDLQAHDAVRASCESESGGSGVRQLRAELRNRQDQPLGSAMESMRENLTLARVEVEQADTYYLRLTASSEQPASPIAHWVRCAVLVNR